MAHITGEAEEQLIVALARVQACIDQLVGVQTIAQSGFWVQPPEKEAEHCLRVLAILQEQQDVIATNSKLRSPSAYADATAWLLRKLR